MSQKRKAYLQTIAACEELLCRFDAGVRPYWLRDWQSGFGGNTKVYEYHVDGATRRRFSVAHVVHPRTNSTNACLCFTLMSKLPEHKPWKRAAGEKDPSRGVILDLQENCDWKMPATVVLHTSEIALSLDDSLQVQCLPECKSNRPKWTYRKVPKVTRFRNFERLRDDLSILRRGYDEKGYLNSLNDRTWVLEGLLVTRSFF